MFGIVGKHRVQRVEADDIGPAIGGQLDQPAQVTEIADAPVAARAQQIELRGNAPQPPSLGDRRRQPAFAGCHHEHHRRIARFDRQTVIAPGQVAFEQQPAALQRCSIDAAGFDQFELTERDAPCSLGAILQRQTPSDLAGAGREDQLDGGRSGIGSRHLHDRQGAEPLGPVQVLECAPRLRFVGRLHTHCSQETAFRLATGLYDFALSIPELGFDPHAFR